MLFFVEKIMRPSHHLFFAYIAPAEPASHDKRLRIVVGMTKWTHMKKRYTRRADLLGLLVLKLVVGATHRFYGRCARKSVWRACPLKHKC